MRANFAKANARTLVHEGGLVNHPSDPGGLTNQGVTQRVYDLHRKAKGLKQQSVAKMTARERDEIYRTRYWDAVKADLLPSGIDYVVYDGAVNSGPGQSVKWLQRALGARYTGKIDGQIGPSTLAAVNDHPNHDALVAAICERRLIFLKALKTWKVFGKGWSARVSQVRKTGQAWASGNIGPDVTFVPNGEAKAPINDAIAAPSPAPGDAASGGGAVGGGIATTINETRDHLSPLAWDSATIGYVVAGLSIASLLLIVGGLAWRWRAKKKAAARADALDLNEALA